MSEIEDNVDINIYRHNGFRLLNLPITVSESELSKQFGKIESFKRISGQDNFEYLDNLTHNLYLPVIPYPSYKEYQEANNRLNNQKIRFIDELFWFWPTNLDDSIDEEAWDFLENQDYEGFVEYWEDLNDAEVSTHNLAVFYHVIALDLFITNKNNKKMLDYSGKALNYWSYSLSKNNNFIDFVKKRTINLPTSRLKESFMDENLQDLPKVILSLYRRMAERDIELNKLEEAKKFIDMIKSSDFDSNVIKLINDNLLTFLLLRFVSTIKNFELSSKKIKKDDYKQNTINSISLMRNVAPLLNMMLYIDPDSIKVKKVRDKYIKSLWSQQQNIFREVTHQNTPDEIRLLYGSLVKSIFYSFKLFDFNEKRIVRTEENINLIEKYLKTLSCSNFDELFINLIIEFIHKDFKNGCDMRAIIKYINEAKNFNNVSEEIFKVGFQILDDSYIDASKNYDKISKKLYLQNLNFKKYEMLTKSSIS